MVLKIQGKDSNLMFILGEKKLKSIFYTPVGVLCYFCPIYFPSFWIIYFCHPFYIRFWILSFGFTWSTLQLQLLRF